jgi:hypothetical protein
MKSKIIIINSLFCFAFLVGESQNVSNQQTREYFIDAMVTIVDPVLSALSKNELRETMPVEVSLNPNGDRSKFTYLEAFGRTLSGIAPWLELGPDGTKEGQLREKYIKITLECLKNATNPQAKDFMNFCDGDQALVDAAFLALGLLRAPNQLWSKLDNETQKNILNALKETRNLSPGYNNWLLFTAVVEAAILKFEGNADMVRIQYALHKLDEWYLGDGFYSDGPHFKLDYYNSFCIHPMLLEILNVLIEKQEDLKAWRYKNFISEYDVFLQRAQTYAKVQENMISPEGTYPAIGRSLTYRFGAFHLLSQIALYEKLPKEINPSQVREALKAVIKRQLSAPDTFDENGWLTIGFYGHQLNMAEKYISTGSLYLCTEVFLVLGLKQENPFWIDAYADWSQKRIWSAR